MAQNQLTGLYRPNCYPDTSKELMFTETFPTIQPGQVWRARWDDVLTFVFVDAVHGSFANRVRVAPVTMGDEDADDTAVILPADASDLNIALSIWPELVTEISAIVLDRWIAAVREFDTIDALHQAAETRELLRGLPILNDLSPRWEARRFLELAMEVFASAAEITGGSGDLPALLAGVTSSQLADALDVPLQLARNIKRARAIVVVAQAERLAELVGVSVDEVVAANPQPPGELIELASRRERSDAVRALAQAQHESETNAFLDLVQGAWGLAARGDKVDAEDWSGRLDTYINVTLAPPT